MTATVEPTLEVGKARTRREDARLITGRSRYTDAITPAGTLFLYVVRSPLAHARIVSVDKSAAEAAPGVIAVYTAADLGVEAVALPHAWPLAPDEKAPPRPILASSTVHFAGEAVAVVIGRSQAEARDAADLVEIDYDPLEPILDMEAAAADGAALVHPDLGTNKNVTFVFDSAAAGSGGSVEEAIAAAESDPDSIVVRRRFRQQRLIPAFMEPRSVVVDPTGEQLTIYAATQIPHILRTFTGVVMGIPESKIRVIAPDVGGGFGGKADLFGEDMLCVAVANKLRKPIKWTETRSESLLSANHGRDQIQDITIVAKRDGTVVALDVHLLADMGAYLNLFGPAVPALGAFMFNGIYKFGAYRFTCIPVFTTKSITGAYRGAGRPEATFGLERIMDELAVELGRDPMELRQQNWIGNDEFPFTTVCGLSYDTGNYEQATDQAMATFDYAGLRREQEERRASNDPVQLGIGISTFTEMCGLAPSRMLGALGYGAGGWEAASVRMLATGKVEVVTGTSPHGQGLETAFSQIVADQLGVPYDDVEILHGDTQISAKGLDTYGSRSLAVGGIAVVKATEKVIAKAKKIAAHLLEASEEDLEFSGGRFGVKGTDKGLAIQEVAYATFTAHNYPEDVEPNLDADAVYDPVNFSFPHGTHLAAVEVDTDTGRVHLRKYVCVDDIGTVVNPLIVEGQVHGGLAQGIAQALFEEANYDEQGTLVNGTFVDYTLPSAADLPSFDTATVSTPSTSNPLGVKGVGEAGTIASTPAIVNAVLDAVRQFGVEDIEMPTTSQRVWRAIQAGKGRSTQETPVDTHSPGAGLGSIDPNNPQGEVQ
jgi:aerobic carbon-monoxide dehydrogenase large subunit